MRTHHLIAITATGIAALLVGTVMVASTKMDRGEDVGGPVGAATHDDWKASIPEGFSVSDRLPTDDGDFSRLRRPISYEFCGEEAFGGRTTKDSLRDGAVGPEYADLRDLRLFSDDRSAHRFLEAAAQTALACPEQTWDGTTARHDVREVDLGEEAVRIVLTYQGANGRAVLGASWWDVVRVGNAVLITASSGEHLAGRSLRRSVSMKQRWMAPVVERMCVFAAEGCAGDRR